jgi:hypothetical protein
MIETIGAIIAGATGFLVALGGLLSSRQKTLTLNAKQMRNDLEDRNAQFLSSLRHIYRLEQLIALNGQEIPARPAELKPDWDPKGGKGEKGIEASTP